MFLINSGEIAYRLDIITNDRVTYLSFLWKSYSISDGNQDGMESCPIYIFRNISGIEELVQRYTNELCADASDPDVK